MDTYMIKIDKKKLEQLPENDRFLFLSFAHFANELRALEKLLIWSLPPSSSLSGPEMDGQVTLTLMLLKLIAGKMNEANKLIQQNLYQTDSGRELIELLPRNARDALAKINKHFSGVGTVNIVRNLDAFHYRAAAVEFPLDQIADQLEFYFQKENSVNMLYYFAEVLAARAIFVKLDVAAQDTEKGLTRLQRHITGVSTWFTVLSDALVTAIVKKNGDAMWATAAKPVTLGPLPAFDDVRVPWFVDAEEGSRWEEEAE